MSQIRRVFVEKKPGRDVEAAALLRDIRTNLRAEGLKSLRVVNRYDMENVPESDYALFKANVFAEAPLDTTWDEELPIPPGSFAFAAKFLPGQFDQRADSAEQCLGLIADASGAVVECAKVYILEGELTEDEKRRIERYCVNPVDSSVTPMDKPQRLKADFATPPDVETLEGFISCPDGELGGFVPGLAMTPADLAFCRDYFRDAERRDPTLAEIKVIDTYWSDHCRHTTFLTAIESVAFEDGAEPVRAAYEAYLAERGRLFGEAAKRDISLMDIATIGMKALKSRGLLDDLDESGENNACSINAEIEVGGKPENWLILFKNETHNHPTEIEPFGGAATCLGGAIRDPLSGRAYVYHAMRVTGGGDPRTPVGETLPGKLPQRLISTGAARGFSSYGNQVGLATGLVTEIFHEGYVAKRMEIGAVVGAVKKDAVRRGTPAPGDAVILVGGRTGRDGCGGATGASKRHTAESIVSCGAEVQKGNPPTERKLQRLFRDKNAAAMIKRCNDFGAGGVAVAIGELADGLAVDLDAVPKKYGGLDGTELAISESQERMAVVVEAKDAERFIGAAAAENLEATRVAEVTADRRLCMTWRGKKIIDISRDFLDTNGARQTARALIKGIEPFWGKKSASGLTGNGSAGAGLTGDDAASCRVGLPCLTDPADAQTADDPSRLPDVLSRLNVACQKGLAERFDSTIGAGSVLMPFGGRRQLTPIQTMVSKIPAEGETDAATFMSFGYDPEPAVKSPFHGAVYAVVEAVSKIVAAGGDWSKVRLTLQEYFERMTDTPEKWGKPLAAMLGAFRAQMGLGLPAIGGKDSMSGTFMDMHVPPTLVAFALCVGKAGDAVSPEFKAPGSLLVKLNARLNADGTPDFEHLKAVFGAVARAMRAGKISAAGTPGAGGVAAAVAQMAAGNMIGARIRTESLYGPEYGAFVLETAFSEEEARLEFAGLDHEIIGRTIPEAVIEINGAEFGLEGLIKAWMEPLEGVFPTNWYKIGATGPDSIGIPVFKADHAGNGPDRSAILSSEWSPAKKTAEGPRISLFARPRVLIPVFSGTNCEDDSRRAFERAGARVETVIIRDLNRRWLDESLGEMARLIRQSQIIMIPGGFSAGDEPEGSGKFIAAAFRSPRVAEAATDLLEERGGLILGICNGFQALIKLGLVPYGQIRPQAADSPTLTYNGIGRHMSCLAKTKVVSDKSPWLWKTAPDEIYTIPLSHGEGRFVASGEAVAELAANGQIATQYVDFGGKASMDVEHNPNGSFFAVEGVTSPDGRVLGKMCHNERIGKGLYKNVPGNFDQKIFEAGVGYFA
ncbi:MAG: phosphoribosylformylglycinamidine synthase subunit PurQ [Firmicutes bacterium]|nr:phosphoribosylformylglycinamidine synthase subunit PurQ [Bacillota bacterium]